MQFYLDTACIRRQNLDKKVISSGQFFEKRLSQELIFWRGEFNNLFSETFPLRLQGDQPFYPLLHKANVLDWNSACAVENRI